MLPWKILILKSQVNDLGLTLYSIWTVHFLHQISLLCPAKWTPTSSQLNPNQNLHMDLDWVAKWLKSWINLGRKLDWLKSSQMSGQTIPKLTTCRLGTPVGQSFTEYKCTVFTEGMTKAVSTSPCYQIFLSGKCRFSQLLCSEESCLNKSIWALKSITTMRKLPNLFSIMPVYSTCRHQVL